ncbi:MAG: class I SAM-dependent methyltransferase, partial [Candidatus Elarobacter sp.]
MKRACAVCGEGNAKTLVLQQRFVVPSQHGVHGGYDVVVCDRCGFAFADQLPDQAFFDGYYREMATNAAMLDPDAGYAEAPDAARWHQHSARNIVPLLEAGACVLDVGSYTGHLLSLVRAEVPGIDVAGIDPSPFAARIARERYGIEVRVGSLFDELGPGAFDLVVATLVLEPVIDLRRFIGRLREFLRPGGRLYLELPDASRFNFSGDPHDPHAVGFAEPYLQFNFEHVNYFTPRSLENLMLANGFVALAVEPQLSTFPVIASTWMRGELPRAEDSLPALRRYVEQCRARVAQIEVTIRALAARGEFAVWGAGAHTQRLLGSGGLDAARVPFFVDANPALQGATLAGRPVVAPDRLRERPELPILVSSFAFEGEIA